MSCVGIHLDPMDTQCAGNCCALEQMPQFQTLQTISNSFKQFQTISNNFCISMHFMNFMDLDVSIPHAHCFQAPWQWHCFGCVKGSRKVVSTVFFETNLTTPCYPNFQFATTRHFLCRRVSNSILQIKLVAKPDDESLGSMPWLRLSRTVPREFCVAGGRRISVRFEVDFHRQSTVTYCYVLLRTVPVSTTLFWSGPRGPVWTSGQKLSTFCTRRGCTGSLCGGALPGSEVAAQSSNAFQQSVDLQRNHFVPAVSSEMHFCGALGHTWTFVLVIATFVLAKIATELLQLPSLV